MSRDPLWVHMDSPGRTSRGSQHTMATGADPKTGGATDAMDEVTDGTCARHRLPHLPSSFAGRVSCPSDPAPQLPVRRPPCVCAVRHPACVACVPRGARQLPTPSPSSPFRFRPRPAAFLARRSKNPTVKIKECRSDGPARPLCGDRCALRFTASADRRPNMARRMQGEVPLTRTEEGRCFPAAEGLPPIHQGPEEGPILYPQ